MSYQTADPEGAKKLLDADPPAVYIDVRTVEEFEQGHVPDSYNVPILFRSAAGMQPNPDFVATVERHFERDARLVLGCRSGVRSQRACELLAEHGYRQLTNMAGGFHGAMDDFGRVVQPGWMTCGFESTRESPSGRSWRELSKGG